MPPSDPSASGSVSSLDHGGEYVVGIGASAGGLEALRSFFAGMPAETGLRFVVIQHLAADHKSLMVELLGRSTQMKVCKAEEGMELEPNHIYLIQPGFNLLLDGINLHLEPTPGGKTLNLPIDLFFRSLAEQCKERAVAVILSGTGSDGARGIRAVKEAGGMIMVQAEDSAKFAGMPASAIATGTADYVLPVEDIPEQLVQYSQHPFASRSLGEAGLLSAKSNDLELICKRLKATQGLDFSQYKQATLVRRIERRMNVAQLQDVHEYFRYLNQSTTEAEALTKDLLIGVTKFFRDPMFYDALRRALRELFLATAEGSRIRIWSAACSTGEEAYTLAMMCEEIRKETRRRIDYKVFGTDVDKTALEIAGAGVYAQSVVADLPGDLLSSYFEPDGNENFVVSRALRDHLIFARQDLLSDPPFTKIDLLSCRNLLIYLQSSAQKKLLSLFHFALRQEGLLFLGGSETLGEMSYAFQTLDAKARLYRKMSSVDLRMSDSIPSLGESSHWPPTEDEGVSVVGSRGRRSTVPDRVQKFLLDAFAPATLVVDSRNRLIFTSGNASDYLSMGSGPVNWDVIHMLPRDLGLAVSTLVNLCRRERRMVEMGSVNFEEKQNGDVRLLRVRAEEFDTQSDAGIVTVVTFREDKPSLPDQEDVEAYSVDKQLLNRVAELEDELRNTRDNLQTSVEQQETSNEELQAANEELLAANEELQSTNEELESVNEELYTVNAEYQGKIQELTELNDDMENFTRSTDIGTIFFDREMRIRRFTPVFGKLTALTEADVGRSLTTFAHPVLNFIRELSQDVLRIMGQREQVVELPEHGTFLLRVAPYRVERSFTEALVASLVDISQLKEAEQEFELFLDGMDRAVLIVDGEGSLLRNNQAGAKRMQTPQGVVATRLQDIVMEPDVKALRKHLKTFASQGGTQTVQWVVRSASDSPETVQFDIVGYHRPSGGSRIMLTESAG